MTKPRFVAALCLLLIPGATATTLAAAPPAVHGQAGEMQSARAWSAALRTAGGDQAQAAKPEGSKPVAGEHERRFSFVCGSRKVTSLAGWPSTAASRPLDPARTEDVFSHTDPQTGLQVTVAAIRYADFPAVEWTLFLKNTGRADTPILENVLPLDAVVPIAAGGGPPVLHYAKGAVCSIDDFAPLEKPLGPGVRVDLQPGGGRSSSEHLPFFSLDCGGQGMVVGIGWTGEWRASFAGDAQGRLTVQAGMATTRLKLHPGEEIRTPKILTLFWQGDRTRGQNLLRRFLLAHHRPRPGGKPLVLPVLVGSWGGTPAAEHLKSIQRIIRHDLPVGLYWIDAEWFGKAPWYSSPGNWEVRKDLYPEGFRALSEPLHRSGRKLLLWFEPQRVCEGTPWAKFQDRPGWLLKLAKGTPEYQQRNMSWGVPHEAPRWVLWESRRSQITAGDRLWNMGNAEARQFLTDWLSARIHQFGLDWYREDFNIAPLEYWQEADPPDRRGITEIRFIEGLYRMWDDLLTRHPHLAIDNCASGGRRIDLETIGRATALWRTDWPVDALYRQCHTFGLMSWVPLAMSDGAVLEPGNEYEVRSAMTAGLNVKLGPKADEASDRRAKALIEQYLGVQEFFYGDYYPLTRYSQSQEAWMAYQLHLPERGEGLVVAFRRPGCPEETQRLRLGGLDRDVSYRITNLDTSETQTLPGSQLAGPGLEVRLAKKPGSALLRYAPVKR